MEQDSKNRKISRVAIILKAAYILMLAASFVIVAAIIYIQLLWKPDEKLLKKLTQPVIVRTIEPERGNILARDGRLLAMSFPKYQMIIDPSVRKEEFKKEGAGKEEEWRSDLEKFTVRLAGEFPQMSAADYYRKICSARNAGTRYLRLGKPIEFDSYQKFKEDPFITKGRNKSGIYFETIPARRYPYGRLAYRTIGFVRSEDSGSSNRFVGLDGKFNYLLHGEEGRICLKPTDKGLVRDYDSTYTKAVNGSDIRTTLDIDFQDIADRALRKSIGNDKNIEGGCCVIMEVKTGAIRSMVNLKRTGAEGELDEVENFAIGRRGEPGSVFKITTLMTCLEDGVISSLDDELPTNNGLIEGYRFEADKHILEWEKKDPKVTKDWGHNYNPHKVPVLYGVQKSSNYVFRYLAIKNYNDNPKKFIDRLYMYKLGEAYDIDLDGFKTPTIPDPESRYWSKGYDLGQVAMGYTVGVTPLHLLTFYNAIANKGKMMKPYLVESIERKGKVIEKRGPSVLQGAICSRSTAETVTKALESVTASGGTAWRLEGAKCHVVGKTGTAYVLLEAVKDKEGKVIKRARYREDNGDRKCQGTFVGFFPAEDPQYSIICTIYSKLCNEDYFGGTVPAQAVREAVDKIYDIDPYWNETL